MVLKVACVSSAPPASRSSRKTSMRSIPEPVVAALSHAAPEILSPPTLTVSPGDGLPTCTVIVDALGAIAIVGVVVVVAGIVMAGIGMAGIGTTGAVAAGGVIAVVVEGMLPPRVQVCMALAVATSPALDGSSPTAIGRSMMLSCPVTAECAYANRSCPPTWLGNEIVVWKLPGP